jgi:hypothetical protein
MAMTFDLSANMAVWLGNTAKRLAAGIASEGTGLPAAILLSAKDYYSDVRNITPPANGGTVASVAFARGKAAINIDLRKAFLVSSKIAGKQLSSPLQWYLSQRNARGRFSGKIKAQISLREFSSIQQNLFKRIGYTQSGWNAALNKFQAKIPDWAKSKSAAGSLVVKKSKGKIIAIAKNEARTIGGISDMQRRIDWVSKLHKKRLEKAAQEKATKLLREIFV